MLTTKLVIIALFALTVAQAKKKKSNDWDELEGLLKKIDEIDKKIFDEDDSEEDSSDNEDDENKRLHNPCEDHVCGWGKECMLTKKGKPQCECIRECPEIPDPDPYDKVCSNQNETFSTLCDLYRERCLCKRDSKDCDNQKHAHAHLEYLGECKDLEECTDELMEQFPTRMADWLFQVMRDLKKREELQDADWLTKIEEAEHNDRVKHIYPVIWKFCDLDQKPHDKAVNHHELIPITAPVIPMESCIKPFLKRCDANNDNEITLKEWGKCLGLAEGDIIEQC